MTGERQAEHCGYGLRCSVPVQGNRGRPRETRHPDQQGRGYEEFLAFLDRKSTRLNSSHLVISYAVFCLKKHTSLPRDFLFGYFGSMNFLGLCLWATAPAADVRGWQEGMAELNADVGIKGLIFFFNDTATTEIYTLSLHALFRS